MMINDEAKDWIRLAAAAVVPPIVGLGLVWLGAALIQDYGWTLFLLLPFTMGFTSTIIYAPAGDKSFGRCFGVGLLSLVVIGLLITVSAIEGLICLAMALPIAVPLILIGVSVAWLITRQLRRSRLGGGLSVFLFLVIPLLMGFEGSTKTSPTVHEVVTTVEIDAPIETVWKNVVEFSRIDKEPTGILKLGFAYPISAEIHGRGVGAVRHCNFTTGPFVEPITAWQEPNLLAFDVVEQPAPMTELSPYADLHAAHLEYMRSQKGQFRLYEQNGKTVVEGTTYYTHNIAPDIYWRLFSDEIIHRIHLRVLDHIKTVSEAESARRQIFLGDGADRHERDHQ